MAGVSSWGGGGLRPPTAVQRGWPSGYEKRGGACTRADQCTIRGQFFPEK